MKIDLHSHTTHSDGRNSPAELLKLAKAAGIDILAVTDHDSTEGVAEAVEAGRREGVKVVAGIEVSSRFEDRDVHVLGIGVDIRSAPFQEKLEDMRAKRRERVGKICAALGSLGLKLSADQVMAEAGGKSVGQYLAEGRPANVPTVEVSPAEACRLIRAAGGLPVLAHPGFFGDDTFVERLFDAAPIRGIEVFHRYRSDQKHLRYAGLARRRDLVVTGGSDFHGDEHPHNAKLGDFLTPPAEWQRLQTLIG